MVEAWLGGKNTVDGPSSLTELLTWFSDLDREGVVLEATGSSENGSATDWSEEVYDSLGLDDELQAEIEEIMLRALGSSDAISNVPHAYDKGPCHFSGDEIYASNPEAVVRRFHMILGTN